MRRASYPGVPFSTRKPFTCPSATSRAQSTTTSARVPLPIHFFSPLMTHSSPSRRAEVFNPTESEPCSGSVSANAPSFDSAAISGSQRCFCACEPSVAIDRIANPAWTPRKVPRLPSPRLSSMWTRPGGDRAHRRAAVVFDAVADHAELAELLDERPGELGSFPVAVDDRQHLVVDEGPGAAQVVQLLPGELIGDAEVVGAPRPADAGVHGPPPQESKT